MIYRKSRTQIHDRIYKYDPENSKSEAEARDDCV